MPDFKTATINRSVTPPELKFYFKTTYSGNFAGVLPASRPDSGSTWIAYEPAGQGMTTDQMDMSQGLYFTMNHALRSDVRWGTLQA